MSTIPPFFKPLLLVNGSTLVASAVRALREVEGVDTVIVVTAPSNTEQIVHVTEGMVDHYVVQPRPDGPGDALERAMALGASADTFLVLMGDNTFGEHDVQNVYDEASDAAVGVRPISRPSSERFARITAHGEWVEGKYTADELREPLGTSDDPVWLGPLKLKKKQWMSNELLVKVRTTTEVKIAPIFNGIKPIAVHCDAADIGTPEALL